MLKDGRLTGVKIGHQWRFSSQEINALLSHGEAALHFHSDTKPIHPAAPPPAGAESTSPHAPDGAAVSSQVTPHPLPLHCVQMIQDVFAEVAGVGSVTTGPDGEPLTEISNSCSFCNMILSSEKGRQACADSWRHLWHGASSELSPGSPQPSRPYWATCHAGLRYTGVPINIDGQAVASLVAGQVHDEQFDPQQDAEHLLKLAEDYDLDPDELARASHEVQVLDPRRGTEMGKWIGSVARTFEHIGRERAELLGRLRTIAAMTTFEPEGPGIGDQGSLPGTADPRFLVADPHQTRR
jgi:ligand-binding sensor protein